MEQKFVDTATAWMLDATAHINDIEQRIARLEAVAVEATNAQPSHVMISILSAIEAHLYVLSNALLHMATGNSESGMEHTVLAADAMRLAYRMDAEGTSDGN